MKVGIVGASGYGGIELYRLLAGHKHVDECILYSTSEQGNDYSKSFPHINMISDLKFHNIDVSKIEDEVDVLFLATPAGVSAKLTPDLYKGSLKIIDLSGDLRLKDVDEYEKWYKKTPAPLKVVEEAVYGLPESNKQSIKQATLIANPGCYPTATLLGLYPIVSEGLIIPHSIIVDAKSGISGAGRKATAGNSYAETNENFKIYKVNEHQHIPEIEQQLKIWNDEINHITFSTHLVPMTRGIMSTIYVELKYPLKDRSLVDLYKDYYHAAPFVRIREGKEQPATLEVRGSNYCDIALNYDERTNRVTIVSVIDNLVKGAAGQAVQNFNIMNGFEEGEGLNIFPLYP